MEDYLSTHDAVVDDVLGGGFVRAGLCEIFGDEGVGKTSLALAVAQGVDTCFFDLDDTFPHQMARTLQLGQLESDDPQRSSFNLIAGDHCKDVSQLISAMTQLYQLHDLLIVDPAGVLGSSNVDILAKASAQLFTGDTCVLIVNHCYGLAPPPGDRSMSFYARQRLEIRQAGSFDSGMDVHMRCVKNTETPPFRQQTRRITFQEHVA